MECHRMVKRFDGNSIEISGINIGKFQLGKLGIEPKLIQAASQALLILDASQYDLCESIRGLGNQELKQGYQQKMIDDKLQAQRIYRALAALALNPQGEQLQEAIKMLFSDLLSSEQRTKELEGSDILSRPQQDISMQSTSPSSVTSSTTQNNANNKDSDSSIEIGKETFQNRIEEIKQSDLASKYLISRHAPTNLSRNDEVKKKMEEIKQTIVALNDKYTEDKINGQLDVKSFWPKLGRIIQELLSDPQYREVIGGVNVEILDATTIKITNKIKQANQAHAIEDSTEERIAYNKAELYITEIFRILDDIYASL